MERIRLFSRGLDRRSLGRGAGLGAFAGLFATAAAADEAPSHRAAFQISVEDRKTQALLLGNARNYAAHYRAQGAACAVEIVAFGPGFSMLRADISMMKGELEALQKDLGTSLTVSACHNTRAAIAESEGRQPSDIPLLPGVSETPSGVVRLAELQGRGWAYLRP